MKSGQGNKSTTSGQGKDSNSGTNTARLPFGLTTQRLLIGGGVVAVAVVVVVITVIAVLNNQGGTRAIPGLEAIPVTNAEHVTTPITYPQIPPAGGPHNPGWQNCGVYTDRIADEYAVHSLEHGAVWITYQPDLPADQVQTLQEITRGGSHRLLSPYPGIDSPIILTSWGFQLRLERADDPRLMDFITRFEQGETTPEPGAPCDGGETRTRRQLGLG